VRENWFAGMGCSSVAKYKKQKNKIKKSRYPYILPPHGVSTAHRTQTNFVTVDDLPNVITHAKFEINLDEIVQLAKV